MKIYTTMMLVALSSVGYSQTPPLAPEPTPVPTPAAPTPDAPCVQCCKPQVKPKPIIPSKPKPPVVTKECKPEIRYVEKVVEKVVEVKIPVPKNTLSLLAGYGPSGVYVEHSRDDKYTLRRGDGWMYSLMYERKIDDEGKYSLKGQGVTDGLSLKTGLVGAGYSW